MVATAKSYLTTEVGTKIFAIVNLIIAQISCVVAISALTHFAIIGWLQPNLSETFTYLHNINQIGIVVLLIAHFFASEIIAAVFVLGVFRKWSSWIYAYLMYGATTRIFTLFFIVMSMLGVWEIPESRNNTFAAVTFILSGVYLMILHMVWRTYKKFKSEQAVKKKATFCP